MTFFKTFYPCCRGGLTELLFVLHLYTRLKYTLNGGDSMTFFQQVCEYYHQLSQQYINRHGWSVPNVIFIKEIVRFIDGCKVLEVGAGTGTWSKILLDNNIQIVATDIAPPTNTATNVEKMSAIDAINTYQTEVLFMSWPLNFAYDALKQFKGEKIIYLGEFGGRSGSTNFFNLLDSDWDRTGMLSTRTFIGQDALAFYTRREQNGN